MLIADVNVYLNAHRADAPDHLGIGTWLTAALEGNEEFGVSELVLSAFIRIATNHRFTNPAATPGQALHFCDVVRTARASTIVRPGPRHWDIFAELCRVTQARANVVPDAYLAALAIENGATFVTSDRGFARFENLRIRHPLSG